MNEFPVAAYSKLFALIIDYLHGFSIQIRSGFLTIYMLLSLTITFTPISFGFQSKFEHFFLLWILIDLKKKTVLVLFLVFKLTNLNGKVDYLQNIIIIM